MQLAYQTYQLCVGLLQSMERSARSHDEPSSSCSHWKVAKMAAEVEG